MAAVTSRFSMRRHTPTLYRHPERDADDPNDNEGDSQWSSSSSLRQLNYVPPPGMGSMKGRARQRSPTSFTSSPGNSVISSQLPPPPSSAKYSDIYSQFVQRYRTRPNTFGDPREDPETLIYHREPAQLFEDESDEELARSAQGLDVRERHALPTLDIENMDHLTIEDRERLEWQSMLTSVLDGDVLKSEKSRIQTALLNSTDAGNNRHLDIWLDIRAKLRGRSLQEERRILEERKMHLVDRVIGEIMQFRVQNGSNYPSALHQVNVILQHLDKIQSFYPHLKAFHIDKPAAAHPDFQARCDTLITWSNVLTALRQQLTIFRKWTGSDLLDVTAASPEHEGTSFVERVLKEETIQRTFEKGSLTTVHALIASARDSQVNLAPMFNLLNLPIFEEELVQLISFPTRLAHALLRSRLDYAKHVTDPDVLIVDQMLDDFRLAIGLACTLKRQYEAFLLPDPGGNWNLPSCISEDYDATLLETLKTFFILINWKLKSGAKDIYFRETEILEAQWATFNDVSLVVEAGATLVAEQISSITNKLMLRATNNFGRQVRIPVLGRDKQKLHVTVSQGTQSSSSSVNGLGFNFQKSMTESKGKLMTGQQMISWYEKVLESVKARYRKLQRFSRTLTQKFSNAAEYTLENVQMDAFIESLVESDHFLVYTQPYEREGTYIIASRGLRERPELIKQMLRNPFHVHNLWEDGYRITRRSEDSSTAASNLETDAEEEFFEDSAYLLIISPRTRFLWNGLVMFMALLHINFELKDNRVRLVADGANTRLALAKERFAEIFLPLDEGEAAESHCPPLTCVVEQMAHLPAVNREYRKIIRVTNNLAESIVDAVHWIRNSLAGVPGCADLLESWYAFASEHGQHAQKYMDRPSWLKFNRLLIKLAISWVSFICDDCDPTDRKTFRWAVSALEFVLLRTKRNNILHLPEDQFELLRQKVASCMTLLISHFDILGARSAQDAMREKEKQDELRQLFDTNSTNQNEEDFWEPITPASGTDYEEQNFANMVISGDRSIRRYRDEVLRHLRLLDERRANVGSEQHVVGRVLDDQKPEDQSLMFLASSTSNVSIRWQQGKFIGAGAFGSVYTAINLDTGSVMAVKEIRVQDVTGTPNLYKQIQDELRVMEVLHHPNIVEYYGIEVHRDKVYIFEEYCEGGSLAANLEIGRIADENILQIYTMQMLEGLSYLHSKNIVHRDIKPDNILLDHLGVLKFVDFGAAKVIAKNTRTFHRSRVGGMTIGGDGGLGIKHSLTGTPMYMSPEVIKNDKRGRHGAMDIWSMGCVVLECATGRKPWSNLDNEWAIMFHIGVATQHPPLPENGELSDLGVNFIKHCLTIDPMRRASAEDLMHHPWMEQLMETLRDYEEEELATSAAVEMPSEQEFQGAAVARHAAIEKEKEVEAIKAASPESITPGSEASAADGGLSGAETSDLLPAV